MDGRPLPNREDQVRKLESGAKRPKVPDCPQLAANTLNHQV